MEQYGPKLPAEASIGLAGKPVAISIEVPKVDPLAVPFKEQEAQALEALQKHVVLEKLMAAHRHT